MKKSCRSRHFETHIFCHYKPREFAKLLQAGGLEIIGRYTQTERESAAIAAGWHGIYNTAVCRKIRPANPQKLLKLKRKIEKDRTRKRWPFHQVLRRAIGVLVRPWRIIPGLRRRVRSEPSWRIFWHRIVASYCRLVGKQLIVDLDWYRYADMSIAETLSVCGTLKKRYVVVDLPRSFLFSLQCGENSAFIPQVRDGNFAEINVCGLNLWDICRTSIAKELGYLPTACLNESEAFVTSKYFQWASDCIYSVERYLDCVRPDTVVVFQGGFFDSRIALECSKKRRIRVVGVENSFIADYAFVDSHSGFILNRHRLADLCSVDNMRSRVSQTFNVLEFWKSRINSKASDHRTGGEDIRLVNLPRNKKILLLLGQVASDASIVMDSDLFSSTAAFVAAAAAVTEKHPDWFLVVRLHPKEAWRLDTSGASDQPGEVLWDNTLKALQGMNVTLPQNSCVVSGPGISTHELMERSDVGLTINSQAGLEMLLLGKPVVTAGRCFYARKGFTHDITDSDLLEHNVCEALNEGLSECKRELLYVFCRYLFGYYLLPKQPDLAAARVDRLREILELPVSR